MEYSVKVYSVILISMFMGYVSASEKTEQIIVEENINGNQCVAVTEFYVVPDRVSTLCECLAYQKKFGNAPMFYGRLDFFVKLEDALAKRIEDRRRKEMDEEDIKGEDVKRILVAVVTCDEAYNNEQNSFTLYVSSKPRIFIEVKRKSNDGPITAVKEIMEFRNERYINLSRCQWLNSAINFLFTADGKKNKETWVPTAEYGFPVMYKTE